ncbi:type IV pilus assembly protein PilE [Acinetobacter sp. BIGb0102]|uniref:type IV pilin protein n=1 Tax=Acinetobacter sp. BIGb0102 TaxID=2485131 RepID=UPI000F4FF1DA|nr:prepilin-type N-terminal cleavage/methylation domain-containing protein [Acinetobacter sp. BIGb0102]RPE29891.1 type IV pilus assembly protein PilE [Acinetobacter sp. BIGb0102]
MMNRGFTLIELMFVVVIVAIIAAIAIPSYEHFTRRAVAAQVQQEMHKIAEQLERHKLRNFTYRGFNPRYLYPAPPSPRVDSLDETKQELTLPLESASPKYTLTIVDGSTGNPLLTSSEAIGQRWAIKAISHDIRNKSFLLTSTGVECETITAVNIETDPAKGVGCDYKHDDDGGDD